MKSEVLLAQLESVADQLGIRVSYEQLAASVVHGGLCKVKGAYRVIIDKRTTSEERVTTLAAALASFPDQLAGIAIPPKAREVLRLHEGGSRRAGSTAA
jgi:hypothetical protein